MTFSPLPAEQDCLYQSFRLPCGVILKNRLIKSAMSDSLGDGCGNPTDRQMRLYEKWAQGGVAASIIGEVQIDPRYPEKPGNLVMTPGCNETLLKQLAHRASIDNAQLWPQIGHAGALAHAPISQAKGPSALDLDGLQCEGLSTEEVAALPTSYARTAAIAKSCGFGGVQLHAGHGFLLSQFLSPLFNQRSDAYGGTIEARMRVILEVIEAIREAVGPDFPLAIKINSSDQLEGGLSEEDALIAIALLDKTSIDLIDISGGTYFPGAKASSDSAGSGPYFLDFAKRARAVSQKPLMASGGFKTRQQAIDAISGGAVDVVGMARALVVEPKLANKWREKNATDPVFPRFESTPEGGVTAWYTMQMTALAKGDDSRVSLDLELVLKEYNERDEQRCERWLASFG